MQVAVVGSGYVGTVTAVCLARLGHVVVGLDADERRAKELDAGELPFFEPGLAELLLDTLGTGRLSFTSEPPTAITSSDVVFLCVGTPTGEDGLPDLSQVAAAVRSIAPHLRDGVVIVNKSTVPVGCGNWVRTMLEEALPRHGAPHFSVASNPEFLREGSAIADFLYPDRIVVGGENGSVERVRDLYQPILTQSFAEGRPGEEPRLFVTDIPSAEMIKYAANAFLATKISYANEIAGICELVGADARQVLPAIGADARIGAKFLQPGIGWGGSCFGKDVTALVATAADYGYSASIMRANVEVNQGQRAAVIHKLQHELKVLKGIAPEVTSMRTQGKRVLIVDDLVDTGNTARIVRELLPAAHFATVYAKPLGRPLVDTFITEVSQDTWIYFPWDTGLAFVPPIREGGD